MANQKQRERQAAAKARVCWFCWSDRTGERWWNDDSASACKLRKRPRGSCFHSVKGAGGPPSVSVKEKAKSEELRSEVKRFKAELAEANKAAAAAAKAPADGPSMEVDKGDADRDAARIVELRDQIDGLENLPDSSGAIAALRTAAVKELSDGSQPIAVVEKRKAAKQKHLDGLHQQIAEFQQQRLEAAKGLAAIQVELVDLEAQRAKVAANFPRPSTVVDGAQAPLDSAFAVGAHVDGLGPSLSRRPPVSVLMLASRASSLRSWGASARRQSRPGLTPRPRPRPRGVAQRQLPLLPCRRLQLAADSMVALLLALALAALRRLRR
ncbi:unnamed protein product, partial [Prorocentrum cordatum]